MNASPATVYPEDHELFGAEKLSDGSVWAVGGRSGTTGNRTLVVRHDAVAGWSDLGGPNPSADDYLVDLAHVPGTGTEMWALGTDRTTYGSFLLYHP